MLKDLFLVKILPYVPQQRYLFSVGSRSVCLTRTPPWYSCDTILRVFIDADDFYLAAQHKHSHRSI